MISLILLGAALQAAPSFSDLFTLKHYGEIHCSDASHNLALEISRLRDDEWKLTQHIDGVMDDVTYGRDDVKMKLVRVISLGASAERSEDTQDLKVTEFVAVLDLQIQKQSKIRASLICRKTEIK